MSDQPVFPYSVSCSKCANKHEGQATNSFAYIAAARDAGWDVPEILENKPVLCPTCKVKP